MPSGDHRRQKRIEKIKNLQRVEIGLSRQAREEKNEMPIFKRPRVLVMMMSCVRAWQVDQRMGKIREGGWGSLIDLAPD